ncbi:MAG: trypsin-like peptidase domain-containing protein [Chloroflexi bacterium]|nr:trypsin-like peptidase domain-containing protein [Chloroflexota bacterium]
MTDPTPENPGGAQPPRSDDSDAFVVNPINMARARHASAHGPSAIDKTRKISTVLKRQTGSAKSSASMPLMGSLQLGGSSGCLLLSLLAAFFMLGGILGGMTGGGLVLWANDTGQLALWPDPPTPTSQPTPTPIPVATLTPTPTPLPQPTASTEDNIARIIPSVVTVINQQPQTYSPNPHDGRIVGSGVIVDSRGFIATNHHVIENAGFLNVILANGQTVEAQLIATDPTQDLAVLKVNVADLPAIIWGDSAVVRPGQAVFAIGSPLGDFPSSVSFGIISGLNRALEINEHVIDGLIQTDTAINRGSSGGPLVNSKGEVIGINTFIIRESEDRGVAEGIAFAIPAAAAQSLLNPWIVAATGESVPIPASGEPGN